MTSAESSDERGNTGSGTDASVPAWQFAAAPDSLLFRQTHVTCGGNVLIVGDSHILLCGADRAFPGCDVSARFGRESTEGLEVVAMALRPAHEVVVFDLSSNDVLDPPTLAANLESLLELTGPRQVVLVNTWRADFRNLHLKVNGILEAFADRHPDRVSLVDWAAYIDAHASPFGEDPDYVHFSTEIYRDRIEVLSAAIERSLDRSRVDERPVSESGGT